MTMDYASLYRTLLTLAGGFKWIGPSYRLSPGMRIDLCEPLPIDVILPPGSGRYHDVVFISAWTDGDEGHEALVTALFERLMLQDDLCRGPCG